MQIVTKTFICIAVENYFVLKNYNRNHSSAWDNRRSHTAQCHQKLTSTNKVRGKQNTTPCIKKNLKQGQLNDY